MIRIKHFCILAGVMALAASCSDEALRKIDVEKNRGNEVAFSAMAEPLKANNTRTYYGNYNSENNSYPIFWASKDNIVVASPMGESGHDHAVYHIVVPTTAEGDTVFEGASYADDIVLNDQYSPDGGVRWGGAETGSFYAIYPYSAETLRRPDNLPAITRFYNSINLKDKDADGKDVVTATAKVENVQRIWAPNGTEYKEDTGLLQMYGSNHALVMWAQTDNVKSGEEVNLRFKPLSTCLMMTFECANTETFNKPATIEKITITAGENENIAGNMKIQFPAASTDGDPVPTVKNDQTFSKGTPSWTLEEGTGSNTIEIIPWIRSTDMASGSHPTIQPGQSMQICAFLLPDTYNNISAWTISVEVNGSTYTRNLSPTDAGEDNKNVTLKPGQIHEMKFPAFNVSTEWDFNPASWMNELDDNIYLSQLTFPGSWETYSQEFETKYDYQNDVFKSQTTLGIRAFDLKTRSWSSGTDSDPSNVIISGSDWPGGWYTGGLKVSDVLANIASYILEKAPSETVVVNLRYEPDAQGGNRPIDYQYWMYGLAQAITNYAGYQQYIYTDPITSETTLGDVRGKIVIKINIGEDVSNYWSNIPDSYKYQNNLPALISYSPIKWVTSSDVVDPLNDFKVEPNPGNFTFTSLTSVLEWETWTGEWNSKLINGVPKDRPNIYAWNYSCTNRTYQSGDTLKNNLPTLKMRENALDGLKGEAIAVYNLGYHDEWFLFGCGGMYADDDTSTPATATLNTNILNFTKDMNKWLDGQIKLLFSQNTPCPLGIVFFNQVGNNGSGNIYYGNDILTNLIKMNNAFYLQQKPEDETRSRSARKKATVADKRKKASGYESNGWTVYRP